MRSTWKRALSTILTVCMIASLLVVPAAAEGREVWKYGATDNGTFFTVSGAGKKDQSGKLKTSTGEVISFASAEQIAKASEVTFTTNATDATGKCIMYFSPRGAGGTVKVNSGDALTLTKVETTDTDALSYSYVQFETAANTSYSIKRNGGNLDLAYIEWFPTIAATGVTIGNKPAENKIAVDGVVTLTATLDPANSTDSITWATADDTVATVDQDGKVTGLRNGTVKISVTAGTSGTVKDEFDLIVGTGLSCDHSGTTTTEGAQTATCGQDGHTGRTYCTNCEAEISPDEVISKGTIAHQYNDAGVCTVCSAERVNVFLHTFDDSVTIPAHADATYASGLTSTTPASSTEYTLNDSTTGTYKGLTLKTVEIKDNNKKALEFTAPDAGTATLYFATATSTKLAVTEGNGTPGEGTAIADQKFQFTTKKDTKYTVTRTSTKGYLTYMIWENTGAPVHTEHVYDATLKTTDGTTTTWYCTYPTCTNTTTEDPFATEPSAAETAVSGLITALTPESGGTTPTKDSISFEEDVAAELEKKPGDMTNDELKTYVQGLIEAQLTAASITGVTVEVLTATYTAPTTPEVQRLAATEPAGSIAYTAKLTASADSSEAQIGGTITLMAEPGKTDISSMSVTVSGATGAEGAPKVGDTLTASVADVAAANLDFTWTVGDTAVDGTAATYEVQAADMGKEIKVKATAKSESTDYTGAIAKQSVGTVVGKTMTITVAPPEDLTYDGQVKTLGITVKDGETPITESVTLQYSLNATDWVANPPPIKDAKEYTIYVKALKEGYEDAISAACTFTIGKAAAPELTIAADHTTTSASSVGGTSTVVITVNGTLPDTDTDGVIEMTVTPALGENGSMEKSATENKWTVTFKDVTGDYTFQGKYAGDDNHTGDTTAPLTVHVTAHGQPKVSAINFSAVDAENTFNSSISTWTGDKPAWADIQENIAISSAGKATGKLKYVEGFTAFNLSKPEEQEGWYLPIMIAPPADWATAGKTAKLTVYNGEGGVENKPMDVPATALDTAADGKGYIVLLQACRPGSEIKMKIDWDGAGTDWTESVDYTMDISGLTFEGKDASSAFTFANLTDAAVSTKTEVKAVKTGYQTYEVTVDAGTLTAHKRTGMETPDTEDAFWVGVGIPKFDMEHNSLFVSKDNGTSWKHIGANEAGAYHMTYTSLTPEAGVEGATKTLLYKITKDTVNSETGKTEANQDGEVSAKYTVTFKADKLVYPTYNITKAEVATADCDFGVAEQAKAGDTVEITLNPAEGYEVDTVTVDGEAVTAIEGVYKFTMPAKDVEVAVTFKEATATTRTLTFAVDEGATVTITAPDGAALSAEKTLTVDKTADVKFTVAVTDDTKELKEVKVGETTLTAAEGVYTVAAAETDATVTVTMKDAAVTPVEPMWPDLQYKVTDTLGDAGTEIAGGTVVDTVAGIKLTYGTGSYAKMDATSGGNEGALATASGMVMVKGNTNPTASGNVPSAGTFYKFEASKDGALMVAYGAFSGKTVTISEQAAGATTATLVPGVGGEMSATENKGETINVTAGNTYYLYASGSKVCFYGFSFTEKSATAPDVKINTPASDELVEGKTLQLSATVTPTDATLAWESDTPAVATVDATGKVTAVAPGTAAITVTATKDGETGTDAVTIKVIEAGVYILNVSTDLNIGALTEGQTAGTADYFTMHPETGKTEVAAHGQNFTDGFKTTQRLETGAAFDPTAKAPAVGFTTSGPATVKIWWRPNGVGRDIGIYNGDTGASVVTTGRNPADADKSSLFIDTLNLTDAGKYLVGGTAGNSYIYKIEVTDKAGAATITDVKINTPASTELEAEKTLALTVTKTPAGASETLVWTSSDDTKATVDANGVVTGVAAGTVTITVTAEGTDPAVTDSIELTIKPKAVIPTDSLVFEPVKMNLTEDNTPVTTEMIQVACGDRFSVTNNGATDTNPHADYIKYRLNSQSLEIKEDGKASFSFVIKAGETFNVKAKLSSNSSTIATTYVLKKGTEQVAAGDVGMTGTPSEITWEGLTEGTYTLTAGARSMRILKLELVDPSATPEVNKTALTDAIAAANAAAEAITVDTDAANVAEGTKWVTAEEKKAYTDAIAVAQAVADKADATQTEVDDAVTALATATTTFEAAKKDGTKKPEANKTALNDAIAAAELKLSKATVADNGDEVLTTDNWITAADKTAVETAIATAKAVADKTDATQEEVDGAVTTLNTALEGKFQKGTKVVTKADLEAAIDAAEKASAAITVAEDAADVTKGTKFVKKADKDAYDAKIAEAQAVIDALGDKTDEELTAEDKANIENALHALNEATHTFELAQDEGTKSTGGYRPSGGSSTVSSNKKTETKPDGTKVVTETKRDGTVVVTQTKPDGTKVVTTTDKDGESTTTVTVPASVDKTTVSVPVADATTGMVPVIVKPDGTEEIIRNSSVEDGEVVFPMTESGTIKIVNNAKHFVDLDGHWAEDEANYVSARELFNGVDATHFAPDATMTRGMMATVLFRLDGENKSDKAVDFSDVKAGDWFADAVEWASEVGVINGYTDGSFGPNKSITREELVVMVYRYAGAPKADAADMTGFNDAEQISDWAAEAMNWAIKTGVINGRGNGVLDPKGNATRAEVSAVLERFVKLANQ